MTDDSIRKLLEAQETLRRQLEPVNSGLGRMVEEADRHRELMRVALGPLEELRRAGLLPEATELTAFRQTRDLMAQFEGSFRLPEIAEARRLLREFETSGLAKSLERYREMALEIQGAMDAMRAPWLDVQDRLRSIAGFVELQGIGHALRTMPPFDARLADALRSDLGDWRAKIDWPPDIFTDPLERSAFYAGRGLDRALTASPAAAFQQSLSIAGLIGSAPPLVEGYGAEPQEIGDEDETAFERANAAHDRLMRFETQIRRFIDEWMKATFGDIGSRVISARRGSISDRRPRIMARPNGR